MSVQVAATLRKISLVGGSSLIALLASSPAAAQAVCITTPLGILDCAPDGPLAEITLPGQTLPVTITLPDDYSGAATIDVESTGPIDLLVNGIADVTAVTGPALDLDSGADITARITALSTAGDGAVGALLTAVDDVVLIVDETVTTAGDLADGINVTAGTVNVTAGDVRTVGIESDGVELVSLTGPGVLDVDLIETLGSGSTDALIRAAGDIGLSAGVLRSEGDQALGFDLQNDVGACAVLGAGSCDVEAIVGNITTDGFGSVGGLVVAAGDTDVTVDALQTGGDEAAGLDLSADPTVCAALGTGGCGTAFTVNNLITGGARSPGAIVSAVGDIDGSVGVLRTQGEDSAGLDLSSDPGACVLLGAGACGTSFSVGELTTGGAGSIGALVRAAGPTTANIGLLETLGEGSTGVDIAGDPTACVVLGIGQCDTSLITQRISTLGDLAAGVLVDVPGQIVANLDAVSTDGASAPAITLITDPTACATLGTGACGVVIGSDDGGTPGGPGAPTGGTPGAPGGTDVDTDGDDSPGAVIETPGPVDADFGTVDTDGDDSPAIVVDGGEGPIDVDFDVIDTGGDDSPGVDIEGTGPINVGGGTVNTGGSDSPGIIVIGDDGPVTIGVGAIETAGPGSNGIDVTTGRGDQTILVGPITVSGPGSNGINAHATGCAAVNVTARGPIASAAGTGIAASSGCTVSVTTLAGAPVSGAEVGIDVTSGTGATVTIGDTLASSDGPALNADGGPATVSIRPSGTLRGRVDLTAGDDTLTNAGTFEAAGTSQFGAGADLLVNSGTLRVQGPVTFAGLESLANGGLIDLRDGATDGVLTLPGSYVGTGSAALGVDVGPGTASDRLVIGGAAVGSTAVWVAGPGAFVEGAVVVDAGAGSSAGAFTLATPTAGFADYALVFDAAANDFALYGTPSTTALGAGMLTAAAREVFYAGNDAVAVHLGASGGATDEQPGISRAVWLDGYVLNQERDLTLDAAPFGQARSYDLGTDQTTWGVQAGVDLFGGANSVLGLTAGYADSDLDFAATPLAIDYKSANVGAYGRFGAGGFSLRGLVKYQWFWSDIGDRTIGFAASPSGDGWGGWLEAAYRFGGERFFVEPAVSIEYANISFDDFDGLGTAFASEEADGLRGKAGARVGARFGSGLEAYGKLQAIHEFEGEDRLTLTNAGLAPAFDLPSTDTYGRAAIGLAHRPSDPAQRMSGFIEGTADFGGDVSGFGARAGVAFRF